ncbi:MAG: hypothetical protein ACRC62_01780 [Microcoleus sp.]
MGNWYNRSTIGAGTGAPPLPINYQLSTINDRLSTIDYQLLDRD